MHQVPNLKRKTPTLLSALCGKLQTVVDEALESPIKLSRLNSDSHQLVTQESCRPAPWLAHDENGENTVIELEAWWHSGVGKHLKSPLETAQTELVVSLTAFRSLLDYLDQCLTRSQRLLPSALPKLLLQTCSTQLMQFVKSTALQKAPTSIREVLVTLCYFCLARINGLCSTQAQESHTSNEGRKYSTAALSDFLVQELKNLFAKNDNTLCSVIMASFEQSLHRAIIHDSVWRSGFKPALQQLATLALRISLDASCESRHPNLATKARRTLAFLTWKAIRGHLQIKGLPDDANMSAFEWAMQSGVMSLHAQVTSLRNLLAGAEGTGIESITIPSPFLDTLELKTINEAPMVDYDVATAESSSDPMSRSNNDAPLSKVTLLIKGMCASFHTIEALLKYGGDCTPTSIGEEAFGNMRYHSLECGMSILKVDTTTLWPALVQSAQAIVQLIDKRALVSVTLGDLRSFFQEYCETLTCIVESFPPAKAAMFSKYLRQILAAFLVDFETITPCIQVLCVSNGSLSNLMDVISLKLPSLFLSKMVSSESPAEGTRQWYQDNAVKVFVFEQLSHSAFALLHRIRNDIMRAHIGENLVKAVQSMHHDPSETSAQSPSEDNTVLAAAVEHPLMNPTVTESLSGCIVELFRIIASCRQHGSRFAPVMRPSIIEEELEIVWFLFRGLESIQSIKGSALAYKNINSLFSSKVHRSTESFNVELGNTLAWLNAIHQSLLANEARGLDDLIILIRSIMVPPSSMTNHLTAKKSSPFLRSVIALLCQWEKELTRGHLRTIAKGSTLASLHETIVGLRALESLTPTEAGITGTFSNQHSADRLGLHRRFTSEHADSIVGLMQQLEDAWSGVFAKTEEKMQSTWQHRHSDVTKAEPRGFTGGKAYPNSPNLEQSSLSEVKTNRGYSSLRFAGSDMRIFHDKIAQGGNHYHDDDEDHDEAEEEDEMEDQDEAEEEEEDEMEDEEADEEENDGEMNQEGYERGSNDEDEDSDVTMTSPEESSSEPYSLANHHQGSGFGGKQPKRPKGMSFQDIARSDDSIDLQESRRNSTDYKSSLAHRSSVESLPVPFELMTIEEDEDAPADTPAQGSRPEVVSLSPLQDERMDDASPDKLQAQAANEHVTREEQDVSMAAATLSPDEAKQLSVSTPAEPEETATMSPPPEAVPVPEKQVVEENAPTRSLTPASLPSAEKDLSSQEPSATAEVTCQEEDLLTKDSTPVETELPNNSSKAPILGDASKTPAYPVVIDLDCTSDAEDSRDLKDDTTPVEVKQSMDPADAGQEKPQSESHEQNETTKDPIDPAALRAEKALPSDELVRGSETVTEVGLKEVRSEPSYPLETESKVSDLVSKSSAELLTYSPYRVITEEEAAVLLTDDELCDGEEEEECVTITEPVIVNIGTPEVRALDELKVPAHLVDSPKSFESGISSPNGYDTSLLDDKNEEYLTSLARSHDISDED